MSNNHNNNVIYPSRRSYHLFKQIIVDYACISFYAELHLRDVVLGCNQVGRVKLP